MTVFLLDVVDGMQMGGNEGSAFLNLRTGEVFWRAGDILSMAEEEQMPEHSPEWEQKEIRLAMEVIESENYLPLPSKFEINEWSIMRDFADSRGAMERDKLHDTIHGSGAFRIFRQMIESLGIREEWFRFRDEALAVLAAEFLDEHGIAYVRTGRRE